MKTAEDIYFRFHGIKHPNMMGGPDVEKFLTHLAVDGQVSASTQNQALGALLRLFKKCWRGTSASSTPHQLASFIAIARIASSAPKTT